LGAVIIAVLGLTTSLRRTDIGRAERALNRITGTSAASVLQQEFAQYFEQLKQKLGVLDWLEWADQYRNMFVHRGRRMTFSRIVPIDTQIFDGRGRLIPRSEIDLHLAKYPDRSEIEALMKGPDTTLNEDAKVTLNGIFGSCRDLHEYSCERLLSVWIERKKTPSLVEQPISQWDTNIRSCQFTGYEPHTPGYRGDFVMINPSFHRRFVAAAIDDAHIGLWNNSPWRNSG
jgi:hypothetical protein